MINDHNGAGVPWCQVNMVPGYHGTMVPWLHGPWYRIVRNRAEQCGIVRNSADQTRTKQELDWTELDWTELDWTRLDWTRMDQTGRDQNQ